MAVMQRPMMGLVIAGLALFSAGPELSRSALERPFQGRCKGGDSFASRRASPRFRRCARSGVMRLRRRR